MSMASPSDVYDYGAVKQLKDNERLKSSNLEVHDLNRVFTEVLTCSYEYFCPGISTRDERNPLWEMTLEAAAFLRVDHRK